MEGDLRPKQCWVGQMVHAVLYGGGVRLGMVSYNYNNDNDESIKIVPIWGYEAIVAYYAVEIISDDALNLKQRLWLEGQRRAWKEYWWVMEMPIYSNIKLEEIPCSFSGRLS